MNENLPKRKNNRLLDYDYSQNGAYFIIICTKDKKHLFGAIFNDENCRGRTLGVPQMILSKNGQIVKTLIESIKNIYEGIFVPHYIIMPNHIHLIIQIDSSINIRDAQCASPTKSLLAKIVNALKSLSSKKANTTLWQRSYHDHIIRNQEDYNKIAEYIIDNPNNWLEDRYYT